MHENVLASVVRRDEAPALEHIEPFANAGARPLASVSVCAAGTGGATAFAVAVLRLELIVIAVEAGRGRRSAIYKERCI